MGLLLHDQDDVSFEHNVNYDNHSELIDEKEDSIIDGSAAPSNYLQSIMTNVSTVQKKRTILPVFWSTVTKNESFQYSQESIDMKPEDCNSVPSLVSRGYTSSMSSEESEIEDSHNYNDVTLERVMKNESDKLDKNKIEAFRISFDLLEVYSSENKRDSDSVLSSTCKHKRKFMTLIQA